MPTDQLHHTGVLVSDIDRAAAFYIDVLGGHWLWKPAIAEGKQAQTVAATDGDVAFKFCYIGFTRGAVELFQFIRGTPDWAKNPQHLPLPHFALDVGNVAEVTRRVVEAGGKQLWDEEIDYGGTPVMYVTDLDGNTIELFEVSLESIVERTLEMMPDVRP